MILKQRLLSIGRTGEPGKTLDIYQGRRIRSTRLFERKPAMAWRCSSNIVVSTPEGKGSKWLDSPDKTGEDNPYLKVLNHNVGATDGAKTCLIRLQTLWKLSQRASSPRAKHLWKLMTSEDLWIAAYKKLAHNEGGLTPGGAKGTIDGTSMKGLKALRDAVKSGTYQMGITRRVYIPKPKGGKRPLGIPEFRDRLVQEVMRTILETIYEPRFLENSHGFRPRRSQHTCLRQIRRDFGATRWVIEGDISKCFDTIDHQVVKKCLNMTIDDDKFISFIMRSLRTKVLMPEGFLEWINSGTPQGGVCSPLLSNIVLHQLDRFILRLKRKIDTGKQRKRNPDYVKLMNASRYYRGTARSKSSRKAAQKLSSTIVNDSDFRRLNYARYADDFIVGLVGPHSLAVRVKQLISRFLKQRLRLELSEEKTLITQLSTRPVLFLGYIIKRGAPHTIKHIQHYGEYTRLIKRRRLGGLTLLVDVEKVVKGLEYKGFCKLKEPVPNFRYMHQTQSYTIKAVNSILRGLNQYYKLSEGRKPAIMYFNYLIRYSLAKMFAAKYKLRTIQKVFRLAGKDLSKPLKRGITSVHGATDQQQIADAEKAGSVVNKEMPGVLYTKYARIPAPDLKPLARKWNPWKGVQETHIPWPITRWTGFSIRGRLALSATCAYCGNDQQIETRESFKTSEQK